jgi:hypothetical protein
MSLDLVAIGNPLWDCMSRENFRVHRRRVAVYTLGAPLKVPPADGWVLGLGS